MRTPRIFIDQAMQPGQSIELRGNAFNHIARVLRLKAGAPVIFFNGEGCEYPARLIALERREGLATIDGQQYRDVESPLAITLGQCVSKGERMDYTIQKCVELGVNTIAPLFSERCNVQLKGDRLVKKIEHWRAVATSACEQCGRNRIPAIMPPQPLAHWLAQVATPMKLALDPAGSRMLNQLPAPDGGAALLIGAEGGLSDGEISAAQQHGFTGIRLGPRVLRTETAAVATLSAMQTLWGDFCR